MHQKLIYKNLITLLNNVFITRRDSITLHSLVSILLVVLPCGIVGLLGGVARMDRGSVTMVLVGVASMVGRGRGYGGGCGCCLVLLHDLEVGRQGLVTHYTVYVLQTQSISNSLHVLCTLSYYYYRVSTLHE